MKNNGTKYNYLQGKSIEVYSFETRFVNHNHILKTPFTKIKSLFDTWSRAELRWLYHYPEVVNLTISKTRYNNKNIVELYFTNGEMLKTTPEIIQKYETILSSNTSKQ